MVRWVFYVMYFVQRYAGYHEIATLMQAISLRDTLYFKLLDESADGDIFETDSDQVICYIL